MDKSLFFLTLSLCCFWLIVDNVVGDKRLDGFLASMFPFMTKE